MSILDFTFTTYQEARAVLNGRDHVTLDGRTVLRHHIDTGIVDLIHHMTVIVRYYPNGIIKVSTDGHYSRSTAQRIARFSPIHPFRRGRRWYAAINGVTTPFYDGLNIATESPC